MKIYILLIIFCQSLSWLSAQPFERFTHEAGLTDTVEGIGSSPQDFGFGVSFYDFNQDGFDDLSFATGNNRPSVFYANEGNGTFNEIFPSGDLLSYSNENKCILWADIDNDGDKDCFITGFQSQNRLYRNDGNLYMTDITFEAGLPAIPDWTYGASFCDINNDGWLDLYVCNRRLEIETNFLYKNNGDNTFSDISFSSGTSDGYRLSFQSGAFDYNNDGSQDIYVSNDKDFRNSLYHNTGEEDTFVDISEISNTGVKIDAMNVGIGDYDNDGFYDIYVTNRDSSNVLLHNNQDGTFSDVALATGVDLLINQNSWGGTFFDFDNDTDLDLFVATSDPGIQTNNTLFVNQLAETGQSVFTNPWPLGLEEDKPTFSFGIGDANNDGRLDISMSYKGNDTVAIYMNTIENDNNWVKLSLQGVYSNRDGIGTRIDLWTGGQRYSRYTLCGESYLSQNSGTVHFGLGTNTVVDSVQIKWLSGIVDVIYNPTVNQVVQAIEGTHNAYIQLTTTSTPANCSIGNNGSAEVHIIGDYDFEYIWSNGATTFDNSGLIPGDYPVTVTLDGISGITTATVGVIPEGIEIPDNDDDENCDGIFEYNDTDNDGYSYNIDCDDTNPEINPGAIELPNNDMDENCDDILLVIDADNDGYNSDEDCNDADAEINPAANEIANNNIDENCDQFVLIIDIDQDGFNSDEDCNDTDASINPAATEIANNDIDENCDDIVLVIDIDNDGYNSGEDCNDLDPASNPGEIEIPNNQVDEDCNGDILIIDLDNDGYNSDEDCDDLNSMINPGATEITGNLIDEDCDGEILSGIQTMEEAEVSIFPIPSKDLITLSCSFEIKEVFIYNVTGHLVLFQSFDFNFKVIPIHLNGLTDGFYFVKIISKNDKFEIWEKIIKI